MIKITLERAHEPSVLRMDQAPLNILLVGRNSGKLFIKTASSVLQFAEGGVQDFAHHVAREWVVTVAPAGTKVVLEQEGS